MTTGKFVIGAIFSLLATAGSGADTFGPVGAACAWHGYNQIMSQPAGVIEETVRFNYADAREALGNQSVVGSPRPAFVWAMETNNSCGIAIGYLNGGTMHAESIQKCDCFHTRMLAYR